MKVGDRLLGPDEPVYVIAEVGVNHNGDPELAGRLIDAAADVGADAVKFQTFSAERLASADAPKAAYQLGTTDPGETQIEMLRHLELPEGVYRALVRQAERRGLQFLSTPFDEQSADVIEALGVPAFKVGSGDVTNIPLLEHLASKGKPLLLSTGMSYLGEVERAVATIADMGQGELVLLHCVSNYPAAATDSNLAAITTLGAAFGLPVGFSDHTIGRDVALAAVALGACVVEKHLTLDTAMDGPDHSASAEPAELAGLIRGIRTVEAAIGNGRKCPAASEANGRRLVRRSIVAAVDIPEGSLITPDMLISLRPAGGIPPRFQGDIAGRRARRPLARGRPISWTDLE